MRYGKSLQKEIQAPIYEKVGTLCDQPEGLTCSFEATRRWGKGREIKAFRTFEEAAIATKNGEVDSFVVPAAYPELAHFIMDAELLAEEAFITQIPALVAVSGAEEPGPIIETLFCHPATLPLLPELPFGFKRSITVTSNSMACVAVLEEGLSAGAITNELCASFYKLNIRKVLRPGIKMPFICFVRASAESPADKSKSAFPPL